MNTAVKVIVAAVILGVLVGFAWVLVPELIPASPETVMAATRDTLADIDSAEFDITMKMTVDGKEVALDGRGGFSLPLALQLTGTMTADGRELPFEERLVDGTLYFRIGEDQQWYAVEDVLSSEGLDVAGMGASSPDQYFAYFDAIERIEDFGTQTIRGVECRHLLLEIDEAALAELIGQASGDETAALNALISTSTSRVEVWVGVEDGLPYREIIETQSSQPVASSSTAQIDFTAFDTDPIITAPAGAKPVSLEGR